MNAYVTLLMKLHYAMKSNSELFFLIVEIVRSITTSATLLRNGGEIGSGLQQRPGRGGGQLL